jgi:glycosyltransferase involved in cell wall biosynthesis
MAAALLFISNLGIGGSERKSVRIANALLQAGHDIHLAYLNAPHTLRGRLDQGLPVFHLDRTGKVSFPALGRLKRYILGQQISHVACVNLYPLLYAQAVAWQLGKRAPLVSALINTTDFRTSRDERQMILYAPLLRRATHLVFGCALQQEQWIDRYKLPAAKSRVIYNGVDHAHFNPAAVAQTREQLRRRYGFPLDAFIVITVGVLRPEKQQTDLIQAVAVLASRGLPVHALLVGDGDERGAIERCIADLGVRDRVHLAGAADEVRPFLKLADAFVVTSTSVETFSNAALEAMAMGLPVILSRIGGAAEMVEAARSGFLYTPGDVTQLAGHIATLTGDEVLTREMGRAAMTRMQGRFGFARMLDEYRTLLYPDGADPRLASSWNTRAADFPLSPGNPYGGRSS